MCFEKKFKLGYIMISNSDQYKCHSGDDVYSALLKANSINI